MSDRHTNAGDPIRALEDVMNNPIARTALDDELHSRILGLTAACGRVPVGCIRCGEPVREVLDGDPLCQAHCDEWARAEGEHALDQAATYHRLAMDKADLVGELCEALAECVRLMWADNPADGWKDAIDTARAVLARAKGEA